MYRLRTSIRILLFFTACTLLLGVLPPVLEVSPVRTPSVLERTSTLLAGLAESGPPVPLIVLGVAVTMLLVEVRRPGRSWPKVSGWWTRAALLNSFQAGAVYLAGVTWDPWLAARRPWSADGLGIGWGALLGYLVVTFVYYWWHRWRHEVPALWRWLHRVHHSPQRLEVATSFYKHPFEILVNSVLSAAILYGMVGLGPLAATWAVLLTGLAELFYHWNVETPHWIGYVVQRPESHCVHHEHGIHAFNYSDLPLWDLLFGTFHNPRRFEGRCGLGESETRLGSLLLGRDPSNADGTES